ncbi:hypothetical protein [Lysinibacillus sp. NPDC059133]|uniref:hypothetical protein n=1 Tax=Lysinibacillus sp. NPDC059133 TaxID=3346737 RepID=UPI0036864AFB
MMKEQLIKAMKRNQLVNMMYVSKSGVVSKRRIKIIKIFGDSFQFFCFTRYSDRAMTKRFYCSKTEEIPINETMDLYKVCTELLDKYFEGGASTPIIC